MSDFAEPMRRRMAEVMAERLGVDVDDVSEAMHLAWEATKDVVGGAPMSWQPDLSDPAQALAHRAQMALTREFDGEPLFPACVVVQDNMTGRIGIAATAIELGDVDQLLLLGRGAARRSVRQHG